MIKAPGKTIAIKVDVDTDRGTRIGVANLLKLFSELHIPATFLFSLGPDNTGKAIKRVFRPGFLKKVSRSGVISLYGIRTLLNGTLLPAPHIGRRNQQIMREAVLQGHEVGIHCYDHIKWQDGLATMSREEVYSEFAKANHEFRNIFDTPAQTAGAAGWQANAWSLAAYDDAKLMYGSDTRGYSPFFPRIKETVFTTLQIPTTLPTLDELLGRPEYPTHELVNFYCARLAGTTPNTFTAHAEIEGMTYLSWFKTFLLNLKNQQINFVRMDTIARDSLLNKQHIPICEVSNSPIDGRSGTVATQQFI